MRLTLALDNIHGPRTRKVCPGHGLPALLERLCSERTHVRFLITQDEAQSNSKSFRETFFGKGIFNRDDEVKLSALFSYYQLADMLSYARSGRWLLHIL